MQGGPPLAVAWIPTPQEEPPAPKFAYLASSWRSCAPSWLILALLGLILSPSCSKMAPSWPNIAQHRAKMRQHSLQEHHPRSKKTIESDELSSFFWFSPFLVRSRPRSKKGHQNAPKSAPSWPSWPPSWPSWAHLGAKLANLAPSWPILAPRCAPIAIQMEPQMRHKSHLGPSWRQEGHRGPQKCPWSFNFQRFFIEFWTEFD